ncbi:MAG TPA: tetratricopeptide repeat protein, partial [Longimicrobiaceae bacterium]|nr:tetratricopeptide repeat protein [Longimicrobiaceae bacterium]
MISSPQTTSPESWTRRWRVPPLPAHVSHSFVGTGILEEVSGPLGLLLWQSLRDAMLWAATPASYRARLFTSGAAQARRASTPSDVEPQLREPLETLRAMVESSGSVSTDEVAHACRKIAQWAEERAAMSTALAFSEAAASAAPGHAGMAFAAGRVARRVAEYARAETWFLRAILMGRQSGDWNSYATAFIGLGRIHLQRGAYPRARKYFTRSMRASRRHGLRGVEGQALHYLFVVSAETGNVAEAECWAQEAYTVHGPGHPELPRLAHDLAHFWLLKGCFARALVVFRALLPHFARPSERIAVLANIARSAGGAGERRSFEDAWIAAWELAERPEAQEGAARSMLDLAYGATHLGNRARTEEAARRALEIASGREESKVRLEAEMILEAAHAGEETRPPAPADAGAEDTARGDALAAEIAEGLRACT